MPTAVRAKTPTRLLALAAGLILVVAGCDATSGPTTSAQGDARHVTVQGSGEVQGEPDTLNINASIASVAPDVTGAMNQTSERQQAVIDALVDAGVEHRDISTAEVSLQPQFAGGGDDPQAIVGYRATNSIDIKIRQLDAASQALALIVSSGGDASRINSVNYSLEDDSQLVRDARSRAFDDARDRAEQYAELSGSALGQVISISEATGQQPPPTPFPTPRGADMATVPLEPGEETVGFTVTVVWELS